MSGGAGCLLARPVAAIERFNEASLTNALALVSASAERTNLMRSATRTEGMSDAGVLVTDFSGDAGANGTPWSSRDPNRLARSHVEKGAVNGDNVSAINQVAAIFANIGCERVQQKKRHARPDSRRVKCERKSQKSVSGR